MVENVAYQPSFDREAYIDSFNFSEREKRNRDLYTRRQVETHIGERFNVLLSKTKYEIKDGQIYGENTEEPFIEIVQRGVEYRKRFGNSEDWPREQAELEGFIQIEKTLAGENSKPGDMMLSVSPSGGSYDHNFYDIFTLKEEEGERYIEGRRYSSSLSSKETGERLKKVGLMPEKAEDSPEYFLSHPIRIEHSKAGFTNAENIHRYLHMEHDYATEEEFLEVIKICSPLITSYINTLSESPIDERMQLLTFNAILNKADMAMYHVRSGRKTPYIDKFVLTDMKTEIMALGSVKVREVKTGCGSSGGFELSKGKGSGVFSVGEYGNKEWFICPKCNYKADGPVGNTCPGCGLTKEAYAQESGEPVCD